MMQCRSPCGERGLKSCVWRVMLNMSSRSPCGERGLKWRLSALLTSTACRRSPCGERGLKYPKAAVLYVVLWSLPVRGAWIEMFGSIRRECWRTVAPRAGSVD